MALMSFAYAAGAVAVGLALVRRLRVWQWGSCRSGRQMAGRVAIVTGASSGLGVEAAASLAARHATVVMACRSSQRAQQAVDFIRRHRTTNGILTVMHLDLADMQSVHAFAAEFLADFQRLDLLLNNAGVAWPPNKQHPRRHSTPQGIEEHFAVNYLGHYLLTGLLLERLQSTAACEKQVVSTHGTVPFLPRVVITASSLYKGGHLDFERLADGSCDSDSSGKFVSAEYVNSKLCCVVFGRRLARLLAATDVHVYSACPGWAATGLMRHGRPPWWRLALMSPILLLFLRTAREAVQTLLCCSLDERLADDSGQIYANCERQQYAAVACRDGDADQLWALSERLTDFHYRLTELERAQTEE